MLLRGSLRALGTLTDLSSETVAPSSLTTLVKCPGHTGMEEWAGLCATVNSLQQVKTLPQVLEPSAGCLLDGW